jgi:hypothetical protein
MTLADVLTAVTDFIDDWSTFIVAGLAVGLSSTLLRHLFGR